MLGPPCSEAMWRVLATHSICQFPIHFPTRVLPCAITFQLCVTVCHHVSAGLYQLVVFCEEYRCTICTHSYITQIMTVMQLSLNYLCLILYNFIKISCTLFTVESQFYPTNCLTLTVHLTEALKHWTINTDPNKDFEILAHISEYMTYTSEETILKIHASNSKLLSMHSSCFFSLCSFTSETRMKFTALITYYITNLKLQVF